MSDNFLDQEDEIDDGVTGTNKYLLFHLGNEVYGIGITHVLEVVEMQKITEVPDMPSYYKGVFNLRGKVIPAMDLRIRFRMAEREYDDRTCIIVVRIGDSTIGFIVDTISEVHDIRKDDIQPPPGFKSEDKKGKYISGLGKIGNDVRILIDAERIVTDDDLESISEILKEK